MTRRLMVIVPDRVSDWIAKGEVVDRYFNPGDLFDHVDLVMTNDDRPDPAAIARMAGRATIGMHNLPTSHVHFVVTLGWRSWALRRWSRRAVELIRGLDPDLIRCHGVRLNAFAAAAAKRELGIPYVVSVHSDPDNQLRGPLSDGVHRRLAGRLVEDVERVGLLGADLVLPVYESIVPYLRRLGVTRFEVAYNAIGQGARPKSTWAVRGRRFKAVSVGNQQDDKDPRPIVEAAMEVEDVEMLLVGDGPLHDELVEWVRASGAADRITFVRAMPNERVLEVLADVDLFLYRSAVVGLSKTCIEAAAVGLPIVVNEPPDGLAAELQGGHVRIVDGTAEGYREAIVELMADETERERLGRAALARARAEWDPGRAEARFAEIYRNLLDG